MAGEVIPVKLDDQVSGPAAQAAAALKQLQAQIQSDTAALQKLQSAMAQVQRIAPQDKGTVAALQQEVAQRKQVLGAAQEQAGVLKQIAGIKPAAGVEEAGEATKGLDVGQLRGFFGAIKGGEGSFRGFLTGVNKLGLAKAGAVAAVVAIVVAVIALTKALIDATIALVRFALESANALRAQKLLGEAASGSARGGQELANIVDDVARSVSLSREELGGLANDLARAGLKGGDLEQALRAIAAVQATGGDVGKLKSEIEAAAKAGQSLDQILNDPKIAKAIDVAGKQTLDWNVQLQRLKESFAKLFEGLKIEALLKAMKSLLDLFDQSTASGRALKALAETMLQPIIDAITFLAPYAKAFWKGMLIAILQVTVVVLKIKNAIRDAFGSLGITSAVKWTTIIRYLGQALVYVVVVMGLLAAAFVFAIGVVSGFVGVLFTIVAAIGTVLFSIGSFIDGFVNGGKNLVLGLAEGIKSGASAVIQAALGVAGGAVDAIKGALGIHSPSSVAKALMLNFGAGAEQGLDASADKVQSGMADVVAPPAKGGPAKGAGGRGSVTITINGVRGAEQLKDESFWARVAEVLEGAGAEAAITLEGV